MGNSHFSNNRKDSGSIWWLHPSVIVFIFLIPTYLLTWYAGESTNGSISTSQAYFYLRGNIASLGLLGLIILGVGTFSPIRPRPSHQNPTSLSPTILTGIGALALLGYVYWFKSFILNPMFLWSLLTSGGSFAYQVRAQLDRSAGVASMAQLGLPFAVGYCYLLWTGQRSALSKPLHLMFAGIILATLFRAFAWAERVALIELGVAISFVWAAFRGNNVSQKWKFFVRILPLLGAAAVVGLFAAGEYFRSWSAFYSEKEKSFWGFIFQRLINYYFNALNSGAGQLTVLEWPTYSFGTTLQWLHRLPVAGNVFGYLTDYRTSGYFQERYGDPEFNNSSGLMPIFLELGIVLGLFLLLTIGATAKYLYQHWKVGRSFTGAVYFLFLMTFLELFRYFYLGDSRCFMVTFGLVLMIMTSPKRKNHPQIQKEKFAAENC